MDFKYRERTEELCAAMTEATDNDRIQLRNQIIDMNLKLVSHILKKYKPYSDDDFQNGCLGLIQAADMYQMSRGIPFASFACFCIERAIQLAYKKRQRLIESSVPEDKWVHLDAQNTFGNGDDADTDEFVFDEQAMSEIDVYIAENELSYICDNIIKPCIQEIVDRGKHMPTKVDTDLWQKLEFLLIMDLVFIDSQKQRLNFTQVAKTVGLSITNVRNRHERTMESIFQRMWEYVTLPFSDLLERLRNTHTIPHRLLCLDPGKTTGWCLFEDGKCTVVDHAEDCYNDETVNYQAVTKLIADINPDFIVYEDYKIYANKLDSHSYSPVFTLRLIGAIDAYAQEHKIKTHKQMASVAKGFVTDEKLKQWGYWESGMKHGRDAIRHGCYFLLFYKRGKDII